MVPKKMLKILCATFSLAAARRTSGLAAVRAVRFDAGRGDVKLPGARGPVQVEPLAPKKAEDENYAARIPVASAPDDLDLPRGRDETIFKGGSRKEQEQVVPLLFPDVTDASVLEQLTRAMIRGRGGPGKRSDRCAADVPGTTAESEVATRMKMLERTTVTSSSFLSRDIEEKLQLRWNYQVEGVTLNSNTNAAKFAAEKWGKYNVQRQLAAEKVVVGGNKLLLHGHLHQEKQQNPATGNAEAGRSGTRSQVVSFYPVLLGNTTTTTTTTAVDRDALSSEKLVQSSSRRAVPPGKNVEDDDLFKRKEDVSASTPTSTTSTTERQRGRTHEAKSSRQSLYKLGGRKANLLRLSQLELVVECEVLVHLHEDVVLGKENGSKGRGAPKKDTEGEAKQKGKGSPALFPAAGGQEPDENPFWTLAGRALSSRFRSVQRSWDKAVSTTLPQRWGDWYYGTRIASTVSSPTTTTTLRSCSAQIKRKESTSSLSKVDHHHLDGQEVREESNKNWTRGSSCPVTGRNSCRKMVNYGEDNRHRRNVEAGVARANEKDPPRGSQPRAGSSTALVFDKMFQRELSRELQTTLAAVLEKEEVVSKNDDRERAETNSQFLSHGTKFRHNFLDEKSKKKTAEMLSTHPLLSSTKLRTHVDALKSRTRAVWKSSREGVLRRLPVVLGVRPPRIGKQHRSEKENHIDFNSTSDQYDVQQVDSVSEPEKMRRRMTTLQKTVDLRFDVWVSGGHLLFAREVFEQEAPSSSSRSTGNNRTNMRFFQPVITKWAKTDKTPSQLVVGNHMHWKNSMTPGRVVEGGLQLLHQREDDNTCRHLLQEEQPASWSGPEERHFGSLGSRCPWAQDRPFGFATAAHEQMLARERLGLLRPADVQGRASSLSSRSCCLPFTFTTPASDFFRTKAQTVAAAFQSFCANVQGGDHRWGDPNGLWPGPVQVDTGAREQDVDRTATTTSPSFVPNKSEHFLVEDVELDRRVLQLQALFSGEQIDLRDVDLTVSDSAPCENETGAAGKDFSQRGSCNDEQPVLRAQSPASAQQHRHDGQPTTPQLQATQDLKECPICKCDIETGDSLTLQTCCATLCHENCLKQWMAKREDPDAEFCHGLNCPGCNTPFEAEMKQEGQEEDEEYRTSSSKGFSDSDGRFDAEKLLNFYDGKKFLRGRLNWSDCHCLCESPSEKCTELRLIAFKNSGTSSTGAGAPHQSFRKRAGGIAEMDESSRSTATSGGAERGETRSPHVMSGASSVLQHHPYGEQNHSTASENLEESRDEGTPNPHSLRDHPRAPHFCRGCRLPAVVAAASSGGSMLKPWSSSEKKNPFKCDHARPIVTREKGLKVAGLWIKKDDEKKKFFMDVSEQEEKHL
ncbi:unnamed protein product [Amoebophrya sp. A120]|nr:unnamed protein product [Amoebophrya sp. A120]|eukprot:GSA120T00000464001.1